MAEPTPPPSTLVEMLRRELDASKSVRDHLQFLGRVDAGEQSVRGRLPKSSTQDSFAGGIAALLRPG